MTELNRGSQRTKNRLAQQRWRVAIGIVASLIFIVIWWPLLPLLYNDPDVKPDAQMKAVTDTRAALLAGLLGVGALLNFWQNGRGRRLAEQGQITDRYAKAIDQLGSEKLDVRLGGIYALQRLSHDSSADQATIVEVLSAFVRVHSKPLYRLRSHEADLKARALTSEGPVRQGGGSFREEEEALKAELKWADHHVSLYPLPDDVQAAMTVLGELRTTYPANLKGVYLKRVDLKDACLTDANLEGAIPEGANLKVSPKGANPEKPLEGAHLENAILTGAHLERAILTDAYLEGAHLEKAVLTGAHLEKAVLTDAHLEGANLNGAELEAADLAGAHLNGALLGSAKGLTIGQVKSACCYLSAILPDDIRQRLQDPAPAPSRADNRLTTPCVGHSRRRVRAAVIWGLVRGGRRRGQSKAY